MTKLWLVVRHQYGTMVRRRSFLIGTLGLPLLIGVVMAVIIFFASGSQDTRPIGYVDQAGILQPSAEALLSPSSSSIEIRSFENVSSAERAIEAGEVQGVYVLPADYVQSRQVTTLYWDDRPGAVAWERFARFLRASIASDLPEAVRERALQGPELVIRSADGRRQVAQRDWLSFVLPVAAGLLFMIAVMSSAGYLLRAVTTEKENRTIEVMITSVTPERLIAGKALGLMGVSLTQLLVWGAAAGAALAVAMQIFGSVSLGSVPWSMLGVILLYFVPAYALVGGLMTAIGSAVTETTQGQQIASILNLLFLVPFFLVAVILAQPNGPLVVALTLFPTTAFMTIVMRWSVTIVPLWQMVMSWVLLVTSAVLSVWAAARVLRVGMLRYGQRMSLGSVISAIRSIERE